MGARAAGSERLLVDVGALVTENAAVTRGALWEGELATGAMRMGARGDYCWVDLWNFHGRLAGCPAAWRPAMPTCAFCAHVRKGDKIRISNVYIDNRQNVEPLGNYPLALVKYETGEEAVYKTSAAAYVITQHQNTVVDC